MAKKLIIFFVVIAVILGLLFAIDKYKKPTEYSDVFFSHLDSPLPESTHWLPCKRNISLIS